MTVRARAETGRPPSPHAFEVLEVPRVLELVAGEAGSALGAERVRGLRPEADPERARRALATAEEMRAVLERSEGWALGPIPDAGATLDRLSVEGSVLEPGALIELGTLLSSGRKAARELRERAAPEGSVARVAAGLVEARELEERIDRTFDEAGDVADGASRELGRIRRELRERRARLVERLEEFARSLPDRVRVADASVTVRAGRYCIPVRREGRSSVGGLVHDESASRQTLFVEPPVAIEPMNGIRELELAERREVARILRELTEALRPEAERLRRSLDALVELDALRARARFAIASRGAAPELADGAEAPYRVRQGRHPLLEARGEAAVPFDLDLDASERVLLVSGPNAGGKTVLLKSVGLFSILAQSGIVPPVGPGTELPFFRGFFAVIGDEQSIEASLSTFGAQVRNLAGILDGAGEDSLVLVDEIGTATDPSEGAALAAALLLRLARRVRLTVATTHLGALKTLAGEDERVVNASLRFDAEALEPTFELQRDRPGRSYALEIAGRLGLPDDLLEEARGRLGAGERALDDVLRELEGEKARVERLSAEAERRARETSELLAELEKRATELERRERELEREGRERAERYLLEARAEVEEAIERLERRYAESDAGGEAPREEAARAARGAVERALRRARERAPAPEQGTPRPPPPGIGPGADVRLRGSRQAGRVVELRGDRAAVEVEGLRLTVPVAELRLLDGAEEAGSARGASAPGPDRRAEEGRRPEIPVRTEVDLRGLRVDEVEGVLLPALDAAVVGDLPALRIIHGKGTGALRERVRELLETDRRVPGFRPGDPPEGGTGVTVVEFDGGAA